MYDVQAWVEASLTGEKTYHTRTLLGKRDDPMLDVYARRIVNDISDTERPLLLGICLKSHDEEDAALFESIITKVDEIKTW